MLKCTNFVASLVVIGVLVGQAEAAIVVDQQATLFGTNFVVGEAETGRPMISQSFTPDLNNLTGVAFFVNDPIPSDGSADNAVLTVDVFLGGGSPDGHAPTGGSLGSKSRTLSDIAGLGSPIFEEFTFDTPIGLTPGSEYVIVLTYDDPDTTDGFLNIRGNAVGDAYADGNYLINEASTWQYHDGGTTRDLAFQTFGDDVPEPGSIALLGLGGLMLLKCRRT